MGKKYLNSPIVEAVCEFRFAPETPWDLTIPGLLYKHIKTSFPLKEERILQQLRVNQTKNGEINQETTLNKVQAFLRRDRQCFMNIGDRLISIHTVKPYLTWTKFRPIISKIYNALIKELETPTIERIGLRYINRIEIPQDHPLLEDYFDYGLRLKDNFHAVEVSEFFIGSVFPYADKRDACRVQLVSALPENPQTSALILDLDYFLQTPKSIPADQAIDWVEAAHTTAEALFEDCITDRLREIFREINE